MRSPSSKALLAVLLLSTQGMVQADGDETSMSDQQFGRLLTVFLENPHQDKAADLAKALIIHTMQTPKAAVMLGESEMKWIGDKEDDRSLLLFAAYVSGNTQAQLRAGVKQNDRYSGLITLFSVYRQLQKNDKKFKVAPVDKLLKLHSEGKLLARVVEMEKKEPTKLTPEVQKEIQKLLKKKQ